MHKSVLVPLVKDDCRIIRCRYETPEENRSECGKLFKTFDPSIEVGDMVVVETSSRWNMTVCRVEEVDVSIDYERETGLQWAWQRVDVAAIESLQQAEEQIITTVQDAERKRKKDELKASVMAHHEETFRAIGVDTPAESGEVDSE